MNADLCKVFRGEVMIYLASFVMFLFFVTAMALGMILNKRPLKTEDEATAAIMEGLSCATCHSTLCGFAGKKNHAPRANCEGQQAIPHKNV